MIKYPRLTFSGLKGGSGKTIVSLGLSRYWNKKGFAVKPFKKGPDYIDAMWLSRAAGRIATNLDPFFMSDQIIRGLFAQKSDPNSLAVIEGNRGLFDGLDSDGSCSTSGLVRTLQSPVILVVDCTKVTRTVAAFILGCQEFEPDINIDGVILNNVANQRHANIIQESVEKYTRIPVLGKIPKIKSVLIPERHMGLISDQEYAAEEALENISEIVSSHVDTQRLMDIANNAPSLSDFPRSIWPFSSSVDRDINIGVVKDASLWFYYPENLEALQRAGAQIREVSLLQSDPWPELDGLYMGGGFPETQADELSANEFIKEHVYNLSRSGLPIYAECGGFMYLCSFLECEEGRFPLAGVFPLVMELKKKPQGHGYTRARVVRDNPFHPPGSEFVGHEFHYSCCDIENNDEIEYCLELTKGTGVGGGKEGLIYKNTFACYTHLHALSVPDWATRFVQACKEMSYKLKAES